MTGKRAGEITLHGLLRYLVLATQHATTAGNEQSAESFLDYYPDGTPKTVEFDVHGEKRVLPRSAFHHHRSPGLSRARFRVESDAIPGGEITLDSNDGEPESVPSILVPLKRGLFRRSAHITINIELQQQGEVEAIGRVHEDLLNHTEAKDG